MASSFQWFVSDVQTGTGANQNIAHPLGAPPAFVIVGSDGGTAPASVQLGTHTSTNIVVNATLNGKFRVYCWGN